MVEHDDLATGGAHEPGIAEPAERSGGGLSGGADPAGEIGLAEGDGAAVVDRFAEPVDEVDETADGWGDEAES